MKKSPLERNIYFVIQPLHFVSKIFGLSPLHIDPKHKCDSERTCICFHVSLATFMAVLLLYGLHNNIMYTTVMNDPTFHTSIRVVWGINMLASHLTSILALLFSVTRNRNHITNMLSSISRVDGKLLREHCKQSVHMHQRTYIFAQLAIKLALYGTAFAFCTFSFYDGTWMCYVYIISKTLTTIINEVMTLQYVNIVLILKQRYQYIRHLFSEATFTNEVSISRHVYKGNHVSHDSDKLFLSARCNVTIDTDSRKVCRIHDLQIIYCELYDVLQANNKSYGIIVLMDIMTILTSTVPLTYFGVIILKEAAFNNGDLNVYFKGTGLMCLCFFHVLTFLWLTLCCHSTAEEVQDTLVCIQKLLLYPNRLSWTTGDLKCMFYQLVNVKVEFSVCGLFTLNLQFLCGSVGIIFTYILVLNQFS
jgi:hypothetical protein